VTCASPTQMPIDSVKTFWIECTLHNDQRLITGLAAVIERVALHAGLSEREQQEISTAAVEACGETFARADARKEPASEIKVFIADFPDRIEIKVESADAPISARSAKMPKDVPASHKNLRLMEGKLVDRVQDDARDNRSRITLVKFFAASKVHPAV
jgi:anti-sigma regulatory factor (Ser/Thr protein kinase)